jgi:hypothetical protein
MWTSLPQVVRPCRAYKKSRAAFFVRMIGRRFSRKPETKRILIRDESVAVQPLAVALSVFADRTIIATGIVALARRIPLAAIHLDALDIHGDICFVNGEADRDAAA